jgi:hypothetical protein
MSVLIADRNIVVRKRVLEETWPGGVSAYVRMLETLEMPPQFVLTSDRHLVSASFPDTESIVAAYDSLGELGALVDADTGDPQFVSVNQIVGPLRPCSWLEHRRESGVLTYAWLAGTEPGDLSAPPGWVPRLDRMIEAAPMHIAIQAVTDLAPTLDAICATLDERGYDYAMRAPQMAVYTAGTVNGAIEVTLTAVAPGSVLCVCHPLFRHKVRHRARLHRMVKRANRDVLTADARIRFSVEDVEMDRMSCFASVAARRATPALVNFTLDEMLKLADRVYEVLGARL